MEDGAYEQFCEELYALLDKWANKPEDDRLSNGQVIGALEIAKQQIVMEYLEADDPG